MLTSHPELHRRRNTPAEGSASPDWVFLLVYNRPPKIAVMVRLHLHITTLIGPTAFMTRPFPLLLLNSDVINTMSNMGWNHQNILMTFTSLYSSTVKLKIDEISICSYYYIVQYVIMRELNWNCTENAFNFAKSFFISCFLTHSYIFLCTMHSNIKHGYILLTQSHLLHLYKINIFRLS